MPAQEIVKFGDMQFGLSSMLHHLLSILVCEMEMPSSLISSNTCLFLLDVFILMVSISILSNNIGSGLRRIC